MEEEIEDLVGYVQYTDSQKSVTTSNAYSPDFTDSSSDKNHSSGKETYVIDWEDSDDSDRTFQIRHNPSIINFTNQAEDMTNTLNHNFLREPVQTINRSTATSLQKCSIVSQEIYTQTSKTIFELVAKENDLKFDHARRTLQTQTSVLSVTENKKIEYKIEVKNVSETSAKQGLINDNNKETSNYNQINYNCDPNTSQEDSSNKYPETETQNEITEDTDSDSTFSDQIIHFIDAESCENIDKELDKTTCSINSSKNDSDIEEDSLMINEYRQEQSAKLDSISDTSVPKSVDNDVEELRNKISENTDLFLAEKPMESNLRRFGTLTPLTEESLLTKDNIIDVTPSIKCISKSEEPKKSCTISNPGIRTAVSAENASKDDKYKLPIIHKNKSCPTSPNLNFLFSNVPSFQGNGQNIAEQKNALLDRWEYCTKSLAGGESPLISGRSDPVRSTNESFHLPPIHVEGVMQNTNNRVNYCTTTRFDSSFKESSSGQESICIRGKIKELKIIEKKPKLQVRSRGGSPSRTSSPDEPRLCEVAERGAEALCAQLLRKLRSSEWTEVADTLKELPYALDNFWSVLNETRIADLLRQVTVHVESPRTQVARLACNTIAEILRKTNYVKKPDFYEAVTTLLIKTGSLTRPVRRAANVALDDIVSGIDLSHAVTALCIHGVGHASALVRCAAARLLVVCCALAGGGRGLLRARPPSAAAARRHALRALAALLDDKNIETRKYAERLYMMLRPLAGFEAYFLTDVDVELAPRILRKLDHSLRVPSTR